jgi:hypothetical protein
MKEGGCGVQPGAISISAVAVLVCACGREGPDRASYSTRDSAGIRIVENAAPAWSDADAWRLTQQPVVDIGGLEGEPDYELYHVASAFRMPDGRIVIGNGGSHQIRFYDEAGVHLLDAGREGEGPGEFRTISWVRAYRTDSIAVYDLALRRISIFGADGHFARSFPVKAMEESGMGRADDVFEDGSVLVRAFSGMPSDADRKVARPIEPRYSIGPEGDFEDSLCAYPGAEVIMHSFESMGLVYFGPPLFGRSTYYAVRGNRIYVASNDSYEVRLLARDGSLQSIVRRQYENLEVTDADIETFKEQQLSSDMPSGMRDPMAEVLDNSPIRETMPAFDSLIVDRMGNLWVEEYNRPNDTVPRWTVFTSEGEMLGTVSFPDRFDLQEVGDDYVLGAWEDELEIEHVLMYGLVKPGR